MIASSSGWPLLGALAAGVALAAYAIGSIPWAFIIVRAVTGEDITTHGSGNVGAMNVRRTTGSWGWFVVAMVADVLKGVVPVGVAKYVVLGSIIEPIGVLLAATTDNRAGAAITMAAVAGAVVGHNYSLWMALRTKRFGRTGKGLATGAGSLLAYDWRYFLAVVVIGLAMIGLTRYMMAGQVAASATLPLAAWLLRSPDWPFALLMGLVVYGAHHRRFMGLLRGEEPHFYIHDRGGPRG